MLPWVSRARLEAAESRVEWTEQQLRAAEERLAAALAAEAEKLKAAEAEKQKLLDRILQLSGQPALYAAAPEQSTEHRAQSAEGRAQAGAQGADKGPAVPAPRRLVDVSDIHAAAREAMAAGEFKPKAEWVF